MKNVHEILHFKYRQVLELGFYKLLKLLRGSIILMTMNDSLSFATLIIHVNEWDRNFVDPLIFYGHLKNKRFLRMKNYRSQMV